MSEQIITPRALCACLYFKYEITILEGVTKIVIKQGNFMDIVATLWEKFAEVLICVCLILRKSMQN